MGINRKAIMIMMMKRIRRMKERKGISESSYLYVHHRVNQIKYDPIDEQSSIDSLL